MKSIILVLVLIATCTRAKYEDGYRGGSRRPHFEDSLEESEESSDEQNKYELRYNYESHESYENDDEEEPKVTFSKRKLHFYTEDEDKFFDDVKQYNRQPSADYHKEGYYQENRYVQSRDQQRPDNRLEERNPDSNYEKQKYEDKKYRDERYPEKNYRDNRHPDNKYRDDKYQDKKYPDKKYEKYPDKKYRDEKYPEKKYNRDERYPEKKYQEGQEVRHKVEQYHGDGGYTWKQDREQWAPISPLKIDPAEKPHKNFVATPEQPQPPPPSEAARMARYIVHNSDWTTVSTISTLPKIRNYPFVNVLSVSDGPPGSGSGIPYLYMTELDMTPHDLAVNRRCSISMSLAETDYCKQQKFDPEDPRCAHITLTGEMWRLKNGTQAAKTAEEALFSRHPAMRKWPKDHNFFFATLKLEQIVLLDYFGGPKFVSVTDYLRATPTST